MTSTAVTQKQLTYIFQRFTPSFNKTWQIVYSLFHIISAQSIYFLLYKECQQATEFAAINSLFSPCLEDTVFKMYNNLEKHTFKHGINSANKRCMNDSDIWAAIL